MLSRVPKVSLCVLRTDKMRASLVRESHRYDPYPVIKTSLLFDVPSRPTGEASGDGNLIN